MKVIFICPAFNCSKNINNLFNSIRIQNNHNWRCVLIDDMSTDDTYEVAKKLSQDDDRITIVKNDEKKYALRNVVEQSKKYQDGDDIIAILDGDDELCNSSAVKMILDEYEVNKELDALWSAHRWDVNNLNISKELPQPNINVYQTGWVSSHLKTFRASLLKNISDKNFKNHKDEWFIRGYDQALMLPILHDARQKKYLDEVLYLYKINSASIPAQAREWTEREQINTINFIRARGYVK